MIHIKTGCLHVHNIHVSCYAITVVVRTLRDICFIAYAYYIKSAHTFPVGIKSLCIVQVQQNRNYLTQIRVCVVGVRYQPELILILPSGALHALRACIVHAVQIFGIGRVCSHSYITYSEDPQGCRIKYIVIRDTPFLGVVP